MSETLLTCPTCDTPNFTSRGLAAHKCKGINRSSSSHQPSTLDSQPLEIVTAADVTTAELKGLATSIGQSFELILKFEDGFDEATLEHRLEIGLNIARAQEKFTLSSTNRTGPATAARATLSTVDNVEPPASSSSFNAWLKTSVDKRLKRTTATRYASAFRALGLPLTANPAEIRGKVKTLRHEAGKAGKPMPKISDILKLVPKPDKAATLVIAAPKDSKEVRLGDARESLQNWKDAWEKFVKQGQLDDLQKRDLEGLKEFLLGCNDRLKARLK